MTIRDECVEAAANDIAELIMKGFNGYRLDKPCHLSDLASEDQASIRIIAGMATDAILKRLSESTDGMIDAAGRLDESRGRHSFADAPAAEEYCAMLSVVGTEAVDG